MTRPIRDILTERALLHFVNRGAELANSTGSFDRNGPLVTFIHGPAGVGKSTLLRVYAAHPSA